MPWGLGLRTRGARGALPSAGALPARGALGLPSLGAAAGFAVVLRAISSLPVSGRTLPPRPCAGFLQRFISTPPLFPIHSEGWLFPAGGTHNPVMARPWTKLKWWTPDRVARLVGGVVFVGALVLLLLPATAPYPMHPVSRATSETTVHSVQVTHPNGIDTNTITDTNTIARPSENPSFFAKTFDNVAGVIVVRLALAALAAFIAGAFVQRLLLANFAVKIGPSGLELGDVSASTAEAVKGLREAMKALETQTKAKTDGLERTLQHLENALKEVQQGSK